MSDTTLGPPDDTMPDHLAPLTERRRKLLHALVWLGLNNKRSAEAAGMSEVAAYEAFRAPTFQAALKAEMKVRRAYGRLGNIPALERIREESKNPMAVVAAVKTLEQIADDGPQQASGERPGYVIAISDSLLARLGPGAQIARQGAHEDKPLIEHEPIGRDLVQRADEDDEGS